MTFSEKMKIFEQVWDSLRQEEGRFESPAWHADVLAQRRLLVEAGLAKFTPWKDAKERIRRRVRGSRAA
jgi:hypothetical protein